MSVLDSFIFLLETDNKNALKGINDTGHALDDVKKDANQANKSLLGVFTGVADKAGLTVSSLKDVAIGALGIAGAGLSLNSVLTRTTELLDRVKDAETVGVDISQYDAMQRSFQAMGVEANDFRDSMIDLNEAMGEAASDAKSGKAESFKAFGVSLKDAEGKMKTADQALLELAGSMEKMDKQQATFRIKELGITDNAVIAAMLKGQKALERQIELQKALGVLNEKDAEQLKLFKQSQDELSAIFSRFADVLAIGAVPALQLIIDVTKDVIAWGREHKAFLLGFFGALATAAIPMLITALNGLGKAGWLAIRPLLPIIGAAALLGLVVDDLFAYFSGGESVIGDLVQRFPALGVALEGIKETALNLWGALKVLFSNPSVFLDALVADVQRCWDSIASGVNEATDALLATLAGVWNKLSTDAKKTFSDLLVWVKGLFAQLGGYISDSVSGAANAAYDKLPDFIKKGVSIVTGSDDDKSNNTLSVSDDEKLSNKPPMSDDGIFKETSPLQPVAVTANAANVALAGAISAPSIPNNPSAISNTRQTSVQNTQKIERVEINVGSGDPQQIRTAVSDGMSDSVQQMANQYDDARSH